jgi:hypothetical protein
MRAIIFSLCFHDFIPRNKVTFCYRESVEPQFHSGAHANLPALKTGLCTGSSMGLPLEVVLIRILLKKVARIDQILS